jgi:tol-pal system protein YbgF
LLPRPVTGGVSAAPPQEDLNARVTRLEQVMENQTLVDMITRIEDLQREVQQLRGQIEEQAHTIDTLKRQQRQQYMDVDRRVTRLEQTKSSSDSPDTESTSPESTSPAVDDLPKIDAGEQAAYQKAFGLMRDLRYEQAITAFRQFLKRYPSGTNAHAAQYWIGEALYAKRNFKQAIPEYQRLMDTFPKSPKVPDAMYKLGSSHREMGNSAAATKILQSLVKNYPKTDEAEQARKLLQKLKQDR